MNFGTFRFSGRPSTNHSRADIATAHIPTCSEINTPMSILLQGRLLKLIYSLHYEQYTTKTKLSNITALKRKHHNIRATDTRIFPGLGPIRYMRISVHRAWLVAGVGWCFVNVKKNFHRSLTFFVRVEMTHLKRQKLLC